MLQAELRHVPQLPQHKSATPNGEAATRSPVAKPVPTKSRLTSEEMQAAADAAKTTAKHLTTVSRIAQKVLYGPAGIHKKDFCSGPKLVSVLCLASASTEKVEVWVKLRDDDRRLRSVFRREVAREIVAGRSLLALELVMHVVCCASRKLCSTRQACPPCGMLF